MKTSCFLNRPTRGAAAAAVFLLGAAGLLPGPDAHAALDFSPRYVNTVSDGYAGNSLYITKDGQMVFLAPPPTWKVAGSSAGLTFVSAALPQAEIQFHAASAPLPAAEFDAKWVEEARTRMVKSLPKDAKDVTVEMVPQALNLNGWKTFEVRVQYTYFGDLLQKSVCYIKLRSGEGIELMSLARKGNFDAVHAAAFRMAGSWQMPPPGRLREMLKS